MGGGQPGRALAVAEYGGGERRVGDAMITISLGWGVQSFTLAAMSALGDLPRVDAAIHADTTHERAETYEFAARWAPWLEEHGIQVVTVQDPKPQPVDEYGGMMIPAYMITNKGNGQMSRQCTANWKRAPIRRWLQTNRNKQPVEVWIGISLDEALRMKPSDVKYITHRWPLIEKRMKRNDCVNWLKAHNLEVPPKSSCVFCPFHDMATWRDLKMSDNGNWKKAVEVDEMIHKIRPPFDLFVHPARKPLVEVDVRNQEDRGQLRLWDEECTGYCGL